MILAIIIIFHGLAWITGLAATMVKSKKLLPSLNND